MEVDPMLGPASLRNGRGQVKFLGPTAATDLILYQGSNEICRYNDYLNSRKLRF